jgi:signal transduction histidine kinase
VKFNPGDVFIYEWQSNRANMFGAGYPDGNTVIKYAIQIDSISPRQIAFSARVLHYTKEHHYLNLKYSEDYGFPPLLKYYQEGENADIVEETLYQIPFKFELDRKQNSVTLANKDELIKRSKEILKGRHYSISLIENIAEAMRYNVLYNKSKFFLAPFRYIRTNLDIPDTLTDNKTKILVQNIDNKVLEINGVPNKDISYLNYKIDLSHGLITSSLKRLRTETSMPMGLHYEKSAKQTEPEESLQLLEKTTKTCRNIVVCGHIENPVSKNVTLLTQTKIFGTDLDSKSGMLDEKGNFRFEFKLTEPGLVALMNPNNNHFYKDIPIFLYASPGDSIYTSFSLENKDLEFTVQTPANTNKKTRFKSTIPVNIAFSGDRVKESQLLYAFQNQTGLPPIEFDHNSFDIGTSRVNALIYLDALRKLSALLKPLYEDQMCTESSKYLNSELQAFLYANLFNAKKLPDIPLEFVYPGVPIISANQTDLVFAQLDTINIHRLYNNYGMFSRFLTQNYVNYKYIGLNKEKNKFSYAVFLEPDENWQLCKMLLIGSPLYREVASRLYIKLLNTKNESVTDIQWLGEINEMFELMIERCNDERFRHTLQEIVVNTNNWKKIKHIPDNKFLNLEGKTVTLNSFIDKRATIIYASRNWSTGRYEMDEAAKNHSEINFVHIDEGENFEYWKKWNSRANPIANQLYFSSDSSGLGDIFLNNIAKFIIFDKSGKRIGIEREIETAITVALEGKRQYFKDVSKSVLSGIIFILGFLLLMALAGFMIYKIRMNRKLRKHNQEKRVRELQLAALRAQMNPHFLFNSLNSVQNLVQQNKSKEAHLYLSDFAGLIRKVLKNSDKEEVTLAEEIDTLRKYLNLEKLRFDFDYQIDIEEHIDQNLFMLPSLILQPLAENALTHGLQHKEGEKKLLISVTKSNNEIHIIIEDNGIGIDAAQKFKTNSNGIGLRMNEERIQMMKDKYGGNYSFKLINRAAEGKEGTRVEITIPEEQ